MTTFLYLQPMTIRFRIGNETTTKSETRRDKPDGGSKFMERVPEDVSVHRSKRIFTGRRGDPSRAPRCLAKRRNGGFCQRPKQRNPYTGRLTKCKLHGGLSTGPRTPQGKARLALLRFKHGRYTAATQRARAEMKQRLDDLKKCREEMTK